VLNLTPSWNDEALEGLQGRLENNELDDYLDIATLIGYTSLTTTRCGANSP